MSITDNQLKSDRVASGAAQSDDLAAFLAEHFGPLRRTLRQSFERLPSKPRSAVELARAIGLENSPAWRLWKAAFEEPIEVGASHMVGRVALTRAANLIAKQLGSDAVAEDLVHAHESFAAATKTFAGDDATFRMMLDSAIADSESSDRRFAKLMFDAARYRIGGQIEESYHCVVVTASAVEGFADIVTISASHGIQRLRAGSALPIARRSAWRFASPNPSETEPTERPLRNTFRPVDPASDHDVSAAGPPCLIPSATQLRGAELERVESGSEVVLQLVGGPLGLPGRSSVATGEVLECATAIPSSEHALKFGVRPHLPMLSMVFDIFVHRSVDPGSLLIECSAVDWGSSSSAKYHRNASSPIMLRDAAFELREPTAEKKPAFGFSASLVDQAYGQLGVAPQDCRLARLICPMAVPGTVYEISVETDDYEHRDEI
ncbi:MAG: hypothetical protein AAFO89_09640 [Planctomycetota bacterium]